MTVCRPAAERASIPYRCGTEGALVLGAVRFAPDQRQTGDMGHIPSTDSAKEWQVGRISFTGTLLPIWGVLCGCGAWAIGVIWFLAASGPGPGPFFASGGTAFLSVLAWVYYFRGVRRVVRTSDGTWRFTGPHLDSSLRSNEVLSITRWWSDWTSWMPLYIRTTRGGLFLLPRMRGPSNLLEALQAANPSLCIHRDGGWTLNRSSTTDHL